MMKYGNGDTATDMTEKAKENLKKVFDDMCSYHITRGIETKEDEDGDTIIYTIKYVNVTQKTYRDMLSVYGFDNEEQKVLAELMKTEYLALLGYTGGSGDLGESISVEQYQAIVDAASDANGKKVVEFVLSKVGYPYSQDYRDSGNYYDCSSLAYYAWKNARVDISYEGATTAASEGKYCYDNNLLVAYEEIQPGDLIFYSYGNNGRFMNITHVAIYVGDGKVVEAANERTGVVYRPVQGKASIVFIGRPR
jgi:cell wall-associated NlpC family hydrolase